MPGSHKMGVLPTGNPHEDIEGQVVFEHGIRGVFQLHAFISGIVDNAILDVRVREDELMPDAIAGAVFQLEAVDGDVR